MADAPETESPARASPWPVLVAVGLAVAELGVLFGAFPVAVGGVALLGASLAGFAAEGDVASRPRSLLVVAGALGAAGAVVFVATGFRTRGAAVLVGAALLVVLAAVDRFRAGAAAVE